MEKNTAEVLVRVYAALLWVWAIMLIVLGVAILVFGSQWIAQQAKVPVNVPSIAFTVIAVILLVIAACDIIVGIGAWNYRPWVRVPAIVMSVIHLFNFPFGTATGILGIWLFGFEDAVRERLGGEPAELAAPAKKAPAKKAKKKR